MHPHRLAPLLLSLLAALAGPLPVAAQDAAPSASQAADTDATASELAGTWDFRVDGTTIFRFVLQEGAAGEWLGRWSRPEAFNTDGNNFANLRGQVRTTASMTGIVFLGMVELSFDDPRPGAIPDIFRFRLLGPDRAEMTYVGTDLAPYALVRAAPGAAMGQWEAGRIYRRLASAQPVPAPAAPSAPARATPPAPPVPQRGEMVRFLDLTPRSAAPAASAEQQPAPDPAPETPASEEQATPRIGADFLDGL